MRSALACRSNAAVWMCAIPCSYDSIEDNEHLRKLICLALQVESAYTLHIDSRSIPGYVQIQDNLVLFCLYDTTGASGYLKELDNHKYEILGRALKRIQESRSVEGRIANLLNYATERDLSRIPEQVFGLTADWVEKYSECLTRGCYEIIEVGDEPLEVEPIKAKKNPLFDSEGKQVVVLSRNWQLHYLSERSFLKKVLSYNKTGKVSVVIGSLANEPEPIQISMRNAMCSWMDAHGNLAFHEIDFKENGLDSFYEHGLRFMVDSNWYMVAKNADTGNIIITANADRMLQNTYRIMNGEMPRIGVNGDTLVKKMDIPVTYQPFLCHEGDAYSTLPAKDILSRLGLTRKDTVSQIEISDPYFTSLTNWKTLWLLLKEMAFQSTAQIHIRTWNPEAKDGFDAGYGYYNFWAGVEFQHVDCCTPIQKALRLTDARKVAAWVVGKLRIRDIDVSYEENSPSHDRFMVVSYIDVDGNEHRARIVFGKGFAFLDFRPARSIPLFNDKADAFAKYTGDLTFCRIEE